LGTNVLGIISAILAFISLALPWWTCSVSYPGYTGSVSVYLWGALGEAGVLIPFTAAGPLQNYAFPIYLSLIFVLISGVCGLAVNLSAGKRGKMLLAVAGALATLSIVMFAVDLQLFLTRVYTEIRVFYSGTGGFGSQHSISASLSFGFWVALVAAIIAFVAYIRYPKVTQTTARP